MVRYLISGRNRNASKKTQHDLPANNNNTWDYTIFSKGYILSNFEYFFPQNKNQLQLQFGKIRKITSVKCPCVSGKVNKTIFTFVELVHLYLVHFFHMSERTHSHFDIYLACFAFKNKVSFVLIK